MNQLRPNQMCPLHHRFDCCGRSDEDAKPWRKKKTVRAVSRPGIRIVEDPHHPRGFRELCSKGEIKKRKLEMLSKGVRHCMHCGRLLDDFREIVVGHYESKGHGGAKHDDHRDNIGLSHSGCNLENGSKRVERVA